MSGLRWADVLESNPHLIQLDDISVRRDTSNGNVEKGSHVRPMESIGGDMLIDSIDVTNFRSFRSFSLNLDGASVFLVSENAAGKTSLLMAITKALGKDRGARASRLL